MSNINNTGKLINFIEHAEAGDIILHDGHQYRVVNNKDKLHPRVIDETGQYSIIDVSKEMSRGGNVINIKKKTPASVKVAQVVTAGLSIYGGYKLGSFLGEKLAETLAKKYMK